VGLYLRDMGVRSIYAFGDSKLVTQQIRGESQCQDGILNAYLDECKDIIKSLDTFCISHIAREKNGVANRLAQQASGYEIAEGRFWVKERPTPLCVFACGNESVRESLTSKE
jgi:ribonuclease HI